MSTLIEAAGGSLVVLLGMTFCLWLLSLSSKNVTHIDAFWGLGFFIAAGIARSAGPDPSPRHWLVLGLVLLWSLRLCAHLLWRMRGKGEDRRYAAMRERHGEDFELRSLFIVFWLQAILIVILSAPQLVLQTAAVDAEWTALDAVAGLAFAIGFFFEAAGDWQLTRFRRDPANQGRVLDRGVWRYTRHPNYFGDALQHWAFWLFALAAPGGIWTVFAPILMTVLLLKVSGVTLLEKDIGERRPEYRRYIERTNAFLPWFPRRGDADSAEPR